MTQSEERRGYPIGALSRRTGVKIETIRYYERIGIMPAPDRTPGGNRQYSHNQLKRLSFIKRSRELGFSIEDIRALLEMVDRDDFTCADVHGMTLAHLASVRAKISDLKRLARVLDAMAAECDRGEVPECPVVDALFSAEAGG